MVKITCEHPSLMMEGDGNIQSIINLSVTNAQVYLNRLRTLESLEVIRHSLLKSPDYEELTVWVKYRGGVYRIYKEFSFAL